MSQTSKASHRSRSFRPSSSSSHQGPTNDQELYPDDSSSMVSSNRSSHRSGGGASHSSRSSRRSRRTSHRESNLRKEIFERANLGPIREDYEESHHSQSSRRSGGRNSRALVRRDEDEYDDRRSDISRSSRRTSNRDWDIDEACSQLSRAILSAADQNAALWTKQTQSRSRPADNDHDAFHDTATHLSRRSSHRSASRAGSGHQRDSWPLQRQTTARSRSRSRSREHEQERRAHGGSMARGPARALSHYDRGALERGDGERHRNNPAHTLRTGDLRMSEREMSYSSGLETRHFKAGDEVDVRSRKNIDQSVDGAYSIHDEMDVKMRFGAGVVPGGGGGMSGLRGGRAGRDEHARESGVRESAGFSNGESFARERYDSVSDRWGSGHRHGIYCTNDMYTCPVHYPPNGMAGEGYRGPGPGFFGPLGSC